jgi:thymidylate kinase
MERAADEFHARVASSFERFADDSWQRAHPECGPIARVDARGSEEEVSDRVLTALAAKWPETFAPLLRSQ